MCDTSQTTHGKGYGSQATSYVSWTTLWFLDGSQAITYGSQNTQKTGCVPSRGWESHQLWVSEHPRDGWWVSCQQWERLWVPGHPGDEQWVPSLLLGAALSKCRHSARVQMCDPLNGAVQTPGPLLVPPAMCKPGHSGFVRGHQALVSPPQHPEQLSPVGG